MTQRRKGPGKAEVPFVANVEDLPPNWGELMPGERGVPTFTLRADRPGHIRALMAAAGELREGDQVDALRTLREFELHEEGERALLAQEQR